MHVLPTLGLLLLTVAVLLPAVEILVVPGGSGDGDGSPSRPAGSLTQAQGLARKALTMGKDEVVVVLRGGTWRVEDPLTFTPADGGGEQRWCTWRAEPGTTPTISAGRSLTGWQDLGDGRWSAPLPAGPEPEQLVVNGRWAPPASSPTLMKVEKVERDPAAAEQRGWRITLGKDGVLPDPTTGRLRLVMRKSWSTYIVPIAAVNGRTAILPTDSWLPGKPGKRVDHPNQVANPNMWKYWRVSVEGHPDLLNQPGSWAVDPIGQRLLYRPLPGETPAATTTELPTGRGALVINGTAEAPVTGLRFQGLAFAHAGWRVPASGWDELQAGIRYRPPGVSHDDDRTTLLQAKFWRRGGLEDARLGLSAGDGLVLTEGCRDLTISRATIEDLGGNGIVIGTTARPKLEDPILVQRITISDCTIRRCGRIHLGTIGVWVAIARDCRLERNEISHMPYTGISLGWVWDPTPTAAGGHLVQGNHLHHLVQELCDGAGIYALGNQPGSRMIGNMVHEIRRLPRAHSSPIAAIYLDEGSLGWTVEGNLLYDTNDRVINLHRPGMSKAAKPPATPADAVNTFRGNILVTAADGTAAQRQPPYGKGQRLYGATPEADAILSWGENRLIPPTRWKEESAAILKSFTVGPQP